MVIFHPVGFLGQNGYSNPMDDYSQLSQSLSRLVDAKRENDFCLELLKGELEAAGCYLVIFSPREQIVFCNLPQAQFTQLNECSSLLGPSNLCTVRDWVHHKNRQAKPLVFIHQGLCFTLEARPQQGGLLLLRIELAHGETQVDAKEEGDLSQISSEVRRAEQVQSLLLNLQHLTARQSRFDDEECQDYLRKISDLRCLISDPIVGTCLDLVEKNFVELMSTHSSFSRLYQVLSPTEIRVAEFVRQGMTSRDIAQLLDVAEKTVENHRNNMRDKLGLRNQGVSLKGYLLQLKL